MDCKGVRWAQEPEGSLPTMSSRAHAIHYPKPVDSSIHSHIFFQYDLF
jgi:hypothetical protein